MWKGHESLGVRERAASKVVSETGIHDLEFEQDLVTL